MKKIVQLIDNSSFRNWIFFCLFSSILLRLIILSYFFPDGSYLLFSDQSKYIYRSDLILNGNFFDENWGVLRMPGYPLFLSLIKFIFNDLFFILIIQNIFLLTTYIYIIKLNNYFSSFSIKIFFIFFSISINVILYSQLILTEALILPLCVIFYFLIFEQYYSAKSSNYYKIAIIFGLISLIRPQFVYISPLIIILPLFIKYEKNKLKKIFSIFIIFFLIINFWLIRNLVIYKSYSISASKVPNIVGWYIPIIDQKYSNLSFKDAAKKSNDNWEKYKKNLDESVINNPFELDKYAFTFFIESFDKFPFYEILYTWSYGSLKTLFTPGIVELSYWLKIKKTNFSSISSDSIISQVYKYIFFNENKLFGILILISLIFILIIRIISFFSLYFFLKKKNFLIFLFLIILIGLNLFLIGPLGSARYRVFIDPILILFFSVGVEQILKYFKYKV